MEHLGEAVKEETILFYKKEFDEARSLILSTYGLRLFCEFAIRAANHFNKHPHSSPFSVTQLTFARAQSKGSGDKSLARRRFKNIRARQIVCRSDARHVGLPSSIRTPDRIDYSTLEFVPVARFSRWYRKFFS